MDKFRLIAEIRKRPMLWNNEIRRRTRIQDIADKWDEVARSLGDDVTVEDCRNTFKYLRSSYRMGKIHKRNRIERDMLSGEYDPKKNYDSNWVYYEPMEFFDNDPISLSQGKNQIEIRKDQTIINYSVNHNISSQSSETETICFEVNVGDGSEEEQSKVSHNITQQQNSTSEQKSDDSKKRIEQRKFPYNKQYHNPKRQNLNSTAPEQKSSDGTNEDHINLNSSLNAKEHISSLSSTSKSCSYQKNVIENTDEESIITSKNTNSLENSDKSCSNRKSFSPQYNQFPTTDIKEEPLDIEADSYPMAVEEIQEIEFQSLKSQRLVKNSTIKQNDILSLKPQTEKEKLVTMSNNVNRQESNDKFPNVNRQESNDKFPNVDIKEEPLDNEEIPALDIEEDLNHLVEQKSQRNKVQSLKPLTLNENSTLKRKRVTSSSSKNNDSLSTPLKKKNINDSNCNISPQHNQFPNADIKEEPPLDIEADSHAIAEENSQENEAESLKPQSLDKTSSLKKNEVEAIKPNNSTPKQKRPMSSSSQTDKNSSIPFKKNNIQLCWSSIQDIDDSDFNFLASFLSHMKSLTPLQNLRFRAKMSNLVLSFLTTSHSAREFTQTECNTKKLPMDISDSDCNFLISFWHFTKSLTQLQNLQFRTKMSHLMIDILSKDGIESNDI